MRRSTLFIEFMGDYPKIRLFDFLLTTNGLDFSITDMAENAGIGRQTLYRFWDNLREENIIVPTRTIGKARLFKLNLNNPHVQKLKEIYDSLVLESLKQKSKKITIETN